MLLGGRAVHPLEDRVPDEDGQRSQDEGREQVQVDVVSGAVQVSVGESRGSSWQDGQHVRSPSFSSPANEPLRQVSASGTMLLSFLPLKMPFFLITPKILWVQCKSCLSMKSSGVCSLTPSVHTVLLSTHLLFYRVMCKPSDFCVRTTFPSGDLALLPEEKTYLSHASKLPYRGRCGRSTW